MWVKVQSCGDHLDLFTEADWVTLQSRRNGMMSEFPPVLGGSNLGKSKKN